MSQLEEECCRLAELGCARPWTHPSDFALDKLVLIAQRPAQITR